jgi:hypothetical protein
MLVFFSGYLYGFYFTGLGVMIGIIWVDLCKGLLKNNISSILEPRYL